jgi:hypothetical protein
VPAIAAGVARGVAQNIHDTLFHGVELLDPVVVAGGVSKNRKVLQYPQEAVKRPLRSLPDGEYIGAIGAALIALKRPKTGQPPDIRSFPSFSERPAIRIPSSPEPVLHPFDPFCCGDLLSDRKPTSFCSFSSHRLRRRDLRLRRMVSGSTFCRNGTVSRNHCRW